MRTASLAQKFPNRVVNRTQKFRNPKIVDPYFRFPNRE